MGDSQAQVVGVNTILINKHLLVRTKSNVTSENIHG
jgi:hypothetical protein